jgi:hypothetical protein
VAGIVIIALTGPEVPSKAMAVGQTSPQRRNPHAV